MFPATENFIECGIPSPANRRGNIIVPNPSIQRTLSRSREEIPKEDAEKGAPIVNISLFLFLPSLLELFAKTCFRVRGEAWEPTAGSAFREAGVDSVIGLE